jgi:hypothetical protein
MRLFVDERQEAGSAKTVAAPALAPDLGRPHQTLFQFLMWNAALSTPLRGAKSLVNQGLGASLPQTRMLLKIIGKNKDLP